MKPLLKHSHEHSGGSMADSKAAGTGMRTDLSTGCRLGVRGPAAGRGRRRRVLVLSGTFPSRVLPNYGIFVKERIRALAALPGYEVRVLAPAPYFPPIPGFGRWSLWSRVPRRETVDGLTVVRPRYFLPPKMGGYLEADLLYAAARHGAEQIRREFDFDVIDAHFVYPNGVAAVRLGQHFEVPVVMTGRGEDILRFPGVPFKGRRIRWALQRGDGFVALSRDIARSFERNGAARRAISIIPNGVDSEMFRPWPKAEARRMLGLPEASRIVISVGDRVERKGFHVLIDALSEVLRVHSDVHVVIVGGPGRHGLDYTREIETRIAANRLHDRVHLAGGRPHHGLAQWYSAADLFALLSSREGSPNVLLEALACGIPAVATPVGGIREELADGRSGILLSERSVSAAAEGLCRALDRDWDREAIRTTMTKRDWHAVAENIDTVMDRVLAAHAG